MNKNIVAGIICFFVCLGFFGCLFFLALPSSYEEECKNRIFSDLEEFVDIKKASIVGIIPEKKADNNVSHNGIGSGVIFSKRDDTYYVITARHVVGDKSSSYKLFTINTEFSGETINVDDYSIDVPDEEYYKSLLDVKIESISKNSDLAIISFKSDEELEVLDFEKKDLNIGDKVISIGHPEGDRYVSSYGYVKSSIKSLSLKSNVTGKKEVDKVVEHNCYLRPGNSGGVVLSSNMKIAGINIAGAFNIFGFYSSGYMIPSSIILDFINNWSDK